MPLPVANGSLSLQGTSRPGDALQTAPKRAMLVRMTEETLKALEAHPNHPSLEFEFGDTPAIHIGSAVFPMHTDHESIAHELYLRSAPANKPHAPLKLYAAITGKVLVDRELDTSISDRVRESTVQAAKAKNGKRIVMLDAPPAPTPNSTAKAKAPPKKRKVLNSGAPVVTKRVNVPIQAKNEGSAAPRGPSPLPPQDAVPELPPSVRNRMVHCLATGQRTADDVIRLVGGANPEPGMPEALRQLLDKVAIPNSPAKRGAPSPTPPKYQLRTTSWLDVRPYEWPRLTEGERTTLARQARIAYADLKIPESDPRWDHVRYRAPAGTGAATSTPTSTTKPDPPKRKPAPPKASAASVAKGKPAPPEDNFLRVPSNSSARSSEREREASPDKRRPGSGFKNASGSGSGSSSRDSPAAPAPPPTQQQRRQALVESRVKLVSTPAREERERETPPASRERPKEKAREREREKPVPKKKAKDEPRETPSWTGAVKRKKTAQGQRDEIDEELARAVGSAPAGGSVKRRKMEDGTPVPAPPKKAREPESDRDDRGRDRDRDRDAPPRKVKREREPSPPPPRNVKREREPSPLPERKPKRERDVSPPPQRTVKRERDASPPPPRKIKREREHEPSPAPASKPKRRRSSPIYTSSEDDAPAPKPAPAPGPLPKGRAALRARYRASYAEYMGAFTAMYAERNRIQAALAGAEGEEGEGGVMSEGEVTRLVGRFEVLGADLERIRRAWEERE